MKDGGLDLLARVEVAHPCHQPWDQMHGDAQVRRCEACALKVYNLSEMTYAQARELLNRSEGRLCVRLYKREDGTVITRDCRSPYDALWRKALRAAMTVAAVLAAIVAYVVQCMKPGTAEVPFPVRQPQPQPQTWPVTLVSAPISAHVVMGMMVKAPPTASKHGNVAKAKADLLKALARLGRTAAFPGLTSGGAVVGLRVAHLDRGAFPTGSFASPLLRGAPGTGSFEPVHFGTLSIVSDLPARLEIDGRAVGATPLDIRLRPGVHHLVARAGKVVISKDVVVQAGESGRAHFRFAGY